MLHHVMLWKLKEEYSEEEKTVIKLNAKESFERLQVILSGVLGVKVVIDCIPSSNMDMMVEMLFVDTESFRYELTKAEYMNVINTDIKPFILECAQIDWVNSSLYS